MYSCRSVFRFCERAPLASGMIVASSFFGFFCFLVFDPRALTLSLDILGHAHFWAFVSTRTWELEMKNLGFMENKMEYI